MLVLLVVCFPLMLFVLLLLMERVERPLRDESLGEQVRAALTAARPDEVESLVRAGTDPALRRYWRRLHRRRVVEGRSGTGARSHA